MNKHTLYDWFQVKPTIVLYINTVQENNCSCIKSNEEIFKMWGFFKYKIRDIYPYKFV